MYPSGRVVTTAYDGANRVSGISRVESGQTKNYVSNTGYWAHGALNSYALGNRPSPNTLYAVYSYNSRLQMSSFYSNVGNVPAGYFAVWNNEYGTTDNNGNLKAVAERAGAPGTIASLASVFNQSFTYDGVNRLSHAEEINNWSRDFHYDQYGNMWESGSGLALMGNTPTTNVYVNTGNRMGGYSYDASGNQFSANGDALSYDAENRMVLAVDPTLPVGHNTETYTYDGDGRRVKKSGPDGTSVTVYVYDAMGQLAAEYSTAAANLPCQTCYLITDHLGSTRLVTDENGTVFGRHDFLPFGEEIAGGTAGRGSQWGAGDNVSQKFTSKERDQETGLDFFGARYYGSALGRFTSPDEPLFDQDPVNPQSWNLYSYVRNNPLKNIDPFGQDCITTSNQTSSGVAVTTERGGSAETCSGTYVKGTVNTNSYQYNGTSLSYSFGNDTASGAGTIAFTKYSNDDWAPGSSNMLGAAQIGRSQALVNEFMKQAAIGAVGGVAGRVIGAGLDAFLAARAARAAVAAVDVANLSSKIVRQMVSRGWTAQEIVETVQNGKAYSVVNKATGGAATEYVNSATGKFVVVDNATKQVLQVFKAGFRPNHLSQLTNDIENISSIVSIANNKSVSGELGFSYPNILEAIRLCTVNSIAVLGVELFQVRGELFDTIKMSGYELPDPHQDWSDYVAANNALAEEFVNLNPSGDDHIYVLTSSSWREFCQVQEIKSEAKKR